MTPIRGLLGLPSRALGLFTLPSRLLGLFTLPSRLLMGLIYAYQRLVSPILQAINGPRCRFHPSCSEYAMEAVRTRGVLVGGALAVWRLARCQPFAQGGIDPVPGSRHRSAVSPLKPAGATRAQ